MHLGAVFQPAALPRQKAVDELLDDDRAVLTDLIVAAVALERGVAVNTSDPHVDLFPELDRFRVT